MISIVICSKDTKISPSLEKNIAETIGHVNYEIIHIDNHKNMYSIFEAYNVGIERAKYPIICFMHEDIFFESNNWGNEVLNSFLNEKVGMCGVIGSKYISEVPCGWWFCDSWRGHMVVKEGNTKSFHVYSTDINERVVCIDGFWFCFRKSLFPQIKFDTHLFHGFHCYDMDLSLQVLFGGYDIMLMPLIDIYHKVDGCLNDNFYINCLLLYKKWMNKLPVSVDLDEENLEKNKLFVDRQINSIVKESYFFKYTHSLLFFLICFVEKKLNVKMNNALQFFYLIGFKLWLKYLNHFHYEKERC